MILIENQLSKVQANGHIGYSVLFLKKNSCISFVKEDDTERYLRWIYVIILFPASASQACGHTGDLRMQTGNLYGLSLAERAFTSESVVSR